VTESHERVDLPLACNLGPGDGVERLRRWQHLADTANPIAVLDGPQLRVRYGPAPGVHDELAALAADEAECCSFVSWAVTQDGAASVLLVTADPQAPEALRPIAALFGAV
jgi:hypothetical protein